MQQPQFLERGRNLEAGEEIRKACLYQRQHQSLRQTHHAHTPHVASTYPVLDSRHMQLTAFTPRTQPLSQHADAVQIETCSQNLLSVSKQALQRNVDLLNSSQGSDSPLLQASPPRPSRPAVKGRGSPRR
jgi:hypothetical protein